MSKDSSHRSSISGMSPSGLPPMNTSTHAPSSPSPTSPSSAGLKSIMELFPAPPPLKVDLRMLSASHNKPGALASAPSTPLSGSATPSSPKAGQTKSHKKSKSNGN
ncbi:uncharacterized protein ARMOST_17435 [Armillaria ostoyae]|uniref:Uncharacterized protein n=1 Tax=Armillaria ostoyae TaxID=47428 RepID=A0A284RYZ2_ARMOS|nr:uncharacterized protein ARMOST_17435 [Armillaria ostoyae]